MQFNKKKTHSFFAANSFILSGRNRCTVSDQIKERIRQQPRSNITKIKSADPNTCIYFALCCQMNNFYSVLNRA